MLSDPSPAAAPSIRNACPGILHWRGGVLSGHSAAARQRQGAHPPRQVPLLRPRIRGAISAFPVGFVHLPLDPIIIRGAFPAPLMPKMLSLLPDISSSAHGGVCQSPSLQPPLPTNEKSHKTCAIFRNTMTEGESLVMKVGGRPIQEEGQCYPEPIPFLYSPIVQAP
jgi:hypothetical protein